MNIQCLAKSYEEWLLDFYKSSPEARYPQFVVDIWLDITTLEDASPGKPLVAP